MKLVLDLTNCYGINRIQKEFDFSKADGVEGVYSLYAPNGTLKTSLAKTFKDIAEGKDSKDAIFTERETTRTITIDGLDISPEQLMVINSYDESYSSKQVSTLLVNEALKREYDDALKEVDDKRALLIKELAKRSGRQHKAIAEMICEAFSRPETDFFELLGELRTTVIEDYTAFASYRHADLFNAKVLELITSDNFNQELTEYVETYDKLISQSAVLSKAFNHQKAGVVSKSLSDTGFFSASHTVNLSINGVKQEITSKDRLDEILEDEQNKVFQDPVLKEKFQRVDKKLSTKDTQSFRDFIAEHQALLPEYKNIPELKKKVVCAYLQASQSLWDDLLSTYQVNQQIVRGIVEQAKQQETTWKNVVGIFNKRFSVPFKLRVDNLEEVILNDAVPAITFDFDDGRGATKEVKRETLLQNLSQGEKRALYILNVLFEIEIRKNAGTPILITIDDIADSFDYKNKYAIVEYLKDIAQVGHFYLLILTHNFDFHRIIGSRNKLVRQRRLMASKTTQEIKLNPEKYQNDVFTAWKAGMHQNERFMLASIPFVRNLSEYCGHKASYDTLTSLLHIKPASRDITVSVLQSIFRTVFADKPDLILPNGDFYVINRILQVADEISQGGNETPELEFKVILAMAIRLKAEQFMIAAINDEPFVHSIQSNQTRALFDKYSELFPAQVETISLLDQVNVMTPENIHLNSFMYEPILDMSAHRLYGLYNELKRLS
jgi:purine-nucleoside phosphorylase